MSLTPSFVHAPRSLPSLSLRARSLVGFVVLLIAVGTWSPSASAQITRGASHQGAAHPAVTGGAFALRGTVGQPTGRILGTDPFLGQGFWYAARNDRVALPVELASFTVETDDERVRLTWTTASETGNAGFHVERRTDAVTWADVGFVEGAGTTTAAQAYRFTDAGLPFDAKEATYRLRQVDLDGTVSHSDPVTVQRGAPDEVALHALFPNPTSSGHATLRYELPSDTDVRISVYDVLGREVAAPIMRRHRAGRTETRLRLPHLGSGLYFIRLQAGDTIRTQRLTIAR